MMNFRAHAGLELSSFFEHTHTHTHAPSTRYSLLRELYLDYCDVGDEGALAIADALRARSNLWLVLVGG